MTAIVLLFITGALFLAAEIMLPGGIAGVMGGIAQRFGWNSTLVRVLFVILLLIAVV